MFGLLTGLMYAFVVLLGWVTFWRSWFRVETRPQEIHFATTDDGWRIALSRYHDLDASIEREHPILLCHGLASNGTTFDMGPDLSLAKHLAAEGWDVWALELRGHGYSEAPRWWTGRKYGWCFDDYLKQDMQAAIAYVLDYTEKPQVHWVGHSMGGLLLYSYLATEEEQWIRSGTTVASGLDYSQSESNFHHLNRLSPALRLLPALPYGFLASLVAPFTGWTINSVENFLYWSGNISSRVKRQIHANMFHTISTPVLTQLSHVLEPGGLRSADGSYRYIDGLADSNTPVLALAGDRDFQCPPDVVLHTVDAMQQAGCKVQIFGKEFGQAEHYGHFDLLLGKNAAQEVFPVVAEWLEEYD